MKKKFKTISNFLFYSGLIVGVFGLLKIYEIRSKLPEGVCPIDYNRGTLLIGITLLISSIIVEVVGEKFVKEN